MAAEHWSFQPVKAVQASGVDELVQAKLRAQGLSPSPSADRRTLIRRATFDLIGLPPTANEVQEFVNDQSPDAYPRLIERLLASPHYGEQWARHWLDVARYSDAKGYVYAREEKMWVHASTYRDWVVQALNDDMSYDRFLRLQIAADQMVPARSPDLAAMGFLTIGRRFLGVTHDIIDDRIDVVMRGTQALTVACARCHDHKFDPVPTRDYYSLYGVFQSSAEKLVPCADGGSPELTALDQKNRDLMSKRREEQIARTRSQVREHLEAQLELEKYPEEVFGQILDAKDLNPFIVRRWQSWLDQRKSDPVFQPWHEFLRSKPEDFVAIWQRLKTTGDARVMSFFPQATTDMHDVARCFAEALSTNALKAMLDGPASPCWVPDEHIANNEMYFPTSAVVELWKAQGEVDRFLIKTRGAPAYATVLVDRPIPSTPRVFNRGNPLTKGDAVPRQFLSVFGEQSPFKQGSGRSELAQAITSARNPLTARVMVNRLWQHHFGRGIVSTPSDFGKQGSAPSHPELLDWLAQRFIDSGWSLKAMHRLMMLSKTYQQTSTSDGAALAKGREVDPDNRLLWRMNAHRLTFEEARDAWLAGAGKLDLTIGGRPLGLFASNNTRRTIYALVDRENLPAVMRTFDFANPDLSIPQRSETTVPQQALFGMNHPFVVQQARALLGQPEVKSAAGEQRVRAIYARLFQRLPTREELAAALTYTQPITSPEPSAPDHSKTWLYGVGEWDEAAGKVKSFTPLPHFNGSAWQGDEDWPNKTFGWAQLTATGGHPGNNRQHAVVRRWIAPSAGKYDMRSALIHEPKVGDGIRAFVSHSRLGKLRSTSLFGDKMSLDLDGIAFEAGESLDFIVDIGQGLNSDQFLWSPILKPAEAGTTGSGGDSQMEVWDARADFTGGGKSSLTSWEQLVQVLMLANEFLFVD